MSPNVCLKRCGQSESVGTRVRLFHIEQLNSGPANHPPHICLFLCRLYYTVYSCSLLCIDYYVLSLKEEIKNLSIYHIVISLSNRSSIEKSIKLFLKMKGQIAY